MLSNKMILFFNVAFTLAAVITFVYNYFNRVYSYWNVRNVIGPKPTPFFGNIKDSALRNKHVAVLFKEIYNDYPNEKFVGFYRMTLPTLLIRDLDIVKQILIKDFEAFPDRGIEFSKEGLGDNLFHCDFTTWKTLRIHMTPLFTSKKLKNIVNLFNDTCDKFINHIENVCLEQQEQELTQIFQKYTIASSMVSSFGINVDTIGDNTGVFDKIDKSMMTIPRISEIDLLFPGILRKTNSSLFNKTAIRYCYEIVQAVKLHRSRQPVIMNDAMYILLTLKQQGEVKSVNKRYEEQEVLLKLTDHVMAGQVFIFFAAGYANNTTILSYAMYQLSKNPEIQKKLTAEIDKVLHRFNGEVTYECVGEMTYLDQVLSETLRMYPTTNSLQRCAARDYILPGSDLIIENGLSVIISPLAIHYDHKIYPNPNQFDPDRFKPEIVKKRHFCAYLPFGIGPRACIGTRLAKLQFKVCVVKLLSKFHVEPSRRTKEVYAINPYRSLLGPAEGIYLNIVQRSS